MHPHCPRFKSVVLKFSPPTRLCYFAGGKPGIDASSKKMAEQVDRQQKMVTRLFMAAPIDLPRIHTHTANFVAADNAYKNSIAD